LIYFMGAIYADERLVEEEVRGKISDQEFFFDDRILNAYYTKRRLEVVRAILNERIKLDPENAETYRGYLNGLAI
ncbi:MAG: hypothetical protein WBL19_00090, partial [Minisyncoccia bacterium]